MNDKRQSAATTGAIAASLQALNWETPPCDTERGLAGRGRYDRRRGEGATSDDFTVELRPKTVNAVQLSFGTLAPGGDDDEFDAIDAVLNIENVDAGQHGLGVYKGADGNDHIVTFDPGECTAISFQAFGVAESGGLIDALVELGRRLEPLAVARRINTSNAMGGSSPASATENTFAPVAPKR